MTVQIGAAKFWFSKLGQASSAIPHTPPFCISWVYFLLKVPHPGIQGSIVSHCPLPHNRRACLLPHRRKGLWDMNFHHSTANLIFVSNFIFVFQLFPRLSKANLPTPAFGPPPPTSTVCCSISFLPYAQSSSPNSPLLSPWMCLRLSIKNKNPPAPATSFPILNSAVKILKIIASICLVFISSLASVSVTDFYRITTLTADHIKF